MSWSLRVAIFFFSVGTYLILREVHCVVSMGVHVEVLLNQSVCSDFVKPHLG